MIDIHHHLLFGLDDGSTDLQTSLDMARVAVADGITHVVCTPHANATFAYRPEVNQERISALREAFAAEGLALELGMGCDFHLSFDNLKSLKQHPSRYTINGGEYLLVELPDYGIPGGLSETFYEMRLAGITPILTHPERNATLQANPERMLNWLRGGLLLQVTAGSVIGRMGKTAQQVAHKMLENKWVHFIATDAHNISSRPPQMREAYDLIAQRYGEDYARLICIENPKAAFDSTPMPAQFEPEHLHDDMEPQTWWGRLKQRYGL